MRTLRASRRGAMPLRIVRCIACGLTDGHSPECKKMKLPLNFLLVDSAAARCIQIARGSHGPSEAVQAAAMPVHPEPTETSVVANDVRRAKRLSQPATSDAIRGPYSYRNKEPRKCGHKDCQTRVTNYMSNAAGQQTTLCPSCSTRDDRFEPRVNQRCACCTNRKFLASWQSAESSCKRSKTTTGQTVVASVAAEYMHSAPTGPREIDDGPRHSLSPRRAVHAQVESQRNSHSLRGSDTGATPAKLAPGGHPDHASGAGQEHPRVESPPTRPSRVIGGRADHGARVYGSVHGLSDRSAKAPHAPLSVGTDQPDRAVGPPGLGSPGAGGNGHLQHSAYHSTNLNRVIGNLRAAKRASENSLSDRTCIALAKMDILAASRDNHDDVISYDPSAIPHCGGFSPEEWPRLLDESTQANLVVHQINKRAAVDSLAASIHSAGGYLGQPESETSTSVREAMALVDLWHDRTQAYMQHTATALVHSLLSQAEHHEFLPPGHTSRSEEDHSSFVPSEMRHE